MLLSSAIFSRRFLESFGNPILILTLSVYATLLSLAFGDEDMILEKDLKLFEILMCKVSFGDFDLHGFSWWQELTLKRINDSIQQKT